MIKRTKVLGTYENITCINVGTFSSIEITFEYMTKIFRVMPIWPENSHFGVIYPLTNVDADIVCPREYVMYRGIY